MLVASRLHMFVRTSQIAQFARSTGSVKWFNDKKGYGFIVGADGKDFFVGQNDIRMDGFRALIENQKVEYDVTEGAKGPQAKSVTTPGLKHCEKEGHVAKMAERMGSRDAGEREETPRRRRSASASH